MATLNVKNVPDRLYKRLQARAKRRYRSVSQEVIAILDEVVREPAPMSILDLKGLGKKAWRGIDAEAHVRSERESWE
jgi:plasmid stability protein